MLESKPFGLAAIRTSIKKAAGILTATALCLVATPAHGTIVDFVLIQNQSFLKETLVLTGPALGGSISSVPQAAGSDTTTYFGHIFVDIQPTTIQLMPGSAINAAITGNYAPHDPVTSDPLGPPAVGLDPGNYGLAMPAIALYANQYGFVLDNGNSFAPSTPMGMAGVNFNLAGQGMQLVAGRQAYVSVLGNDTDDYIGMPAVFYGTNGSDIGTWNGVTLTIPVHSMYTFNVTTDFGGLDLTVKLTGQLVAIPYVPEPSTCVLGSVGMIGLAVWGWRRKSVR